MLYFYREKNSFNLTRTSDHILDPLLDSFIALRQCCGAIAPSGEQNADASELLAIIPTFKPFVLACLRWPGRPPALERCLVAVRQFCNKLDNALFVEGALD